jgi:hypothetical protein
MSLLSHRKGYRESQSDNKEWVSFRIGGARTPRPRVESQTSLEKGHSNSRWFVSSSSLQQSGHLVGPSHPLYFRFSPERAPLCTTVQKKHIYLQNRFRNPNCFPDLRIGGNMGDCSEVKIPDSRGVRASLLAPASPVFFHFL